MRAIPEGKFNFLFPANWHPLKYDGKDEAGNPSYYLRYLESINSIKAVDIVAAPLGPARRLLLLEIKDFREDDADLQNKIEQEHFPLEVVQKALHTVSGLYLGVRAGDAALTLFANHLLVLPAPLELVLFLEQVPIKRGPSDRGYRQALYTRTTQRQGIERRLRTALKPLGFACYLFDADTLPNTVGWQVSPRED